jgi:hypothetical protein
MYIEIIKSYGINNVENCVSYSNIYSSKSNKVK